MSTQPEQQDVPTEVLRVARETITQLSSEEGPFGVACKETARSPEPVANTRFDSFEAAEDACRAAESYRDAMRRLDPDLTEYDLAVCAVDETSVDVIRVREQTEERRQNGLPKSSQSVTLAGEGTDEWLQLDNGPVVDLCGPESLLDDEFVSRQLDSTLQP